MQPEVRQGSVVADCPDCGVATTFEYASAGTTFGRYVASTFEVEGSRSDRRGRPVAAELERDGFGNWLGDAPAPRATYPKPKPEFGAPRNVEAEIDELRSLATGMQQQVGEILALRKRPNRKAG